MAAKPAVQTGYSQCLDIVGYLEDPDPAGRVVRAAPSPDARELGRIPPPLTGGEMDPLSASFEILGSRDGWLEIEGAGFDEELAGRPVLPAYKGRGWISGKGVVVDLQSSKGFAEPSHQSAVLVDVAIGASFYGGARGRTYGCSGRWVLVDLEPGHGVPVPQYRSEAVVNTKPLTLRSWVAGVCNIQETTCDGVDGDFAGTSHLDRDPNRGDH